MLEKLAGNALGGAIPDLGGISAAIESLSDPSKQQAIVVSIFGSLMATLIVAELERRPVPESFLDEMIATGYTRENATELYRFVCKSILEAKG